MNERRSTAHGGRPAGVAAVVATLVTGALVAAPVDACSVCFGQTDSPIADGLGASVLFMVGLTYALLVGGVATFVILRRRARQAAPSEP